MRQQGRQTGAYKGADLVIGFLLPYSLKYVVSALCTADFSCLSHSRTQGGKGASLRCAASTAQAESGSVAVSCPCCEYWSQCLSLMPPLLILHSSMHPLLPVSLVGSAPLVKTPGYSWFAWSLFPCQFSSEKQHMAKVSPDIA